MLQASIRNLELKWVILLSLVLMLLLYKILVRGEEVDDDFAKIVRPHLDAAAKVAGGGGSNSRGAKIFWVVQLE